MKLNLPNFLSGFTLMSLLLTSCAQTQITATTKEPAFDAKSMQRVLVIAIVRKSRTQHMLEDAFVKNLEKRKSTGVASYTLVPEGQEMDEAAWKRLVADNRFDAVILSRLIEFDVSEKDVDPKYLVSPTSSGYGYYSSSYRVTYQPGFTLRKETAGVETRVYEAAGEKMVWSAHSKTNIEQGRDPEAVIRDFVNLMMGKIYG